MRTRVKICGVTRPQDAFAAAEAGADAIGVVFHSASPRGISAERAVEIFRAAGALVTCVGLFVDENIDRIRQIAQQTAVAVIQLHGEESPDIVRSLAPLRVIKAIVADKNLHQSLETWRASRPPNLIGLVLETPTGGAPGGTGVANDWTLIERQIHSGDFAGLPPIIAAGGLTAETVGEVIRRLRPWAVDVSSGVEVRKGEKSAEKIAAFMKAVKDTD
ncbi:MAG TPA: phosphoribosylanthranilate isomerase [Tepidisphaeraceae bacterium]|nr:phosphoribosylanthranilate isomerase [Tepidisphaeraceae bacterium]